MRAYLIRLTGAAIIAAVVRKLSGKNGAWKAARFGAGLLVLLTAFGTIGQYDVLAGVDSLVRDVYSDPLSTMPNDLKSNELMDSLIKEQTETYILDKAANIGVEVTVEVETRLEQGYPIPYRVILTGLVPPSDKQMLTEFIAKDLGIPEERQGWMDM